MRIGWLVDQGKTVGGAELTQAEFRAAAPDDVEIVHCGPGGRWDADAYVIHNCLLYTLNDLKRLEGKPVVKYWHDVGPWLRPEVHEWLSQHALNVCCSQFQAEYMNREAVLIPPPVNLDRFAKAAESVNGDRSGTVCVGSWRNHGKAPHKAAEWASGNGGVDFFGSGPFAPPGSLEVSYEGMPALLAQYKTFVFLPTVLEPFGRVVAEAWAAGCELVVNGLVGARWWIEERPEALETAAADFWRLVIDHAQGD